MRKLQFIALLVFVSLGSIAQRFGGTPPGIKWMQINTDTARIIFPRGLDSQATRVASLIHYQAAQHTASLGDKIHKVNIVLQNQTTIANGYVGLGPFRSEFYLNPALNNFDQGSIAWSDLLAIHEYRHVQQYNNFRHGVSKLMLTLFGEEGYAVAANAAIPDWFFEGDAVYNETRLSDQGRGRLAYFMNAYPSLWQAGKKYSWMKLRNGSFKDYVPNHYHLGYLLVNYGREKYGMDFWTKVTRDASAFKGFYPFQQAIKRYTGINYQRFREAAFDYYRRKEDSGNKTKTATPAVTVNTVNEKYVTDYVFPYTAGDDSLIYLKTSYRHRPAFYIKDKTGEHKLRVRDIATDDQFSYRNGKIVYAAYETDPRWSWRDYSVIKLLDVQTNKQYNLTHKTKYFTPDISASGERIAVVQVPANGKSNLHILDRNGNLVSEISSADISLYTDPKFIDEQSLVAAVRLKDGRMALATVDLQSGSTVRLTSPSFNVIGYPSVNKGMIWFTASYEGNDDVFVLRMSDKKIFRVSNGPLGNYFVNAGNGQINWSAFTAEGYQLQQLDEKNMDWKEISMAVSEQFAPAFPVAGSGPADDILLNARVNRPFAASRYKKGTRLLNFHSWRPYYEDPIFTFSVYGENVLNTLQTELYYLYNQNERTNALGFNTVFGGAFPYFSAGTEFTFDRSASLGNKLRQWDQLDSRVGINIPLNKTSGRTFKQFNIGTNYFYRNEFNKGILKDSLGGSRHFSYLHHYLAFAQSVQQAVQHIYPKWGYSIALNHRYAISSFSASQFNGSAAAYLPGLFAAHSLVLTGGFQQVDTLNKGNFGNRMAYARGYNAALFSRMWTASANYHFPIVYPDWGVANILYLQRVRANAFYDFTKVYSRNKKVTADQRSVGGEIYIDTKWWNQYELSFGFRVSHLLDRDFYSPSRNTVFEFVLPVSIIPR